MKKFLKDNFHKCEKFFSESKVYILSAVAVFFATAVIGFVFPVFFREEVGVIMQQMAEKIQGLGFAETFSMIFFNNLSAGFMAEFLGIGFGIFPLIALVINGYLLGFVMKFAVMQEGIFVIWRIIPHGIFEIPAILLAAGIGIKIGVEFLYSFMIEYEKKHSLTLLIILGVFFPVILFIFAIAVTFKNKNLSKKLKINLKEGIRFFISVILPLLLIAAFIEGLLIFVFI